MRVAAGRQVIGVMLRADVVAAALDEAALGTPAERAKWPVVYMSPRGTPFTAITRGSRQARTKA